MGADARGTQAAESRASLLPSSLTVRLMSSGADGECLRHARGTQAAESRRASLLPSSVTVRLMSSAVGNSYGHGKVGAL